MNKPLPLSHSFSFHDKKIKDANLRINFKKVIKNYYYFINFDVLKETHIETGTWKSKIQYNYLVNEKILRH